MKKKIQTSEGVWKEEKAWKFQDVIVSLQNFFPLIREDIQVIIKYQCHHHKTSNQTLLFKKKIIWNTHTKNHTKLLSVDRSSERINLRAFSARKWLVLGPSPAITHKFMKIKKYLKKTFLELMKFLRKQKKNIEMKFLLN